MRDFVWNNSVMRAVPSLALVALVAGCSQAGPGGSGGPTGIFWPNFSVWYDEANAAPQYVAEMHLKVWMTPAEAATLSTTIQTDKGDDVRRYITDRLLGRAAVGAIRDFISGIRLKSEIPNAQLPAGAQPGLHWPSLLVGVDYSEPGTHGGFVDIRLRIPLGTNRAPVNQIENLMNNKNNGNLRTYVIGRLGAASNDGTKALIQGYAIKP